MLGPIDFKALAIVALIFIPLELIFPLHARKPWRRHWQNDLVFLILNVIPITFGMVFFSVLLGEAQKPGCRQAGSQPCVDSPSGFR